MATETFSYKSLVVDEPADSEIAPVPPMEDPMPMFVPELRSFLVNQRGYDPKIVDGILTGGEEVPGIDWTAFYDDVNQFIADPDNIVVVEEADKIFNQLRQEGIDVGVEGQNNLREIMARLGASNIENATETRNWWARAKQQLAEHTAKGISGGAANLSLGLALLDVFERFDKGIKLATMPAKKRHEIENEVLPVVTIGEGEDARSFKSGTTASLWAISQKVWGGAQETLGQLIKLGALTQPGNIPLQQNLKAAGQQISEQGTERRERVIGQVPDLVAALGRPLPWLEVVERNLSAQEEFDDMYKYLEDHGNYGALGTWGLAFGSAALDVFGSPTNVIGGSVSKVPALGRALLKGTAKAAEITAETSRTLHTLDAAVDAVDNAEAYFRRIDRQILDAVSENVRATGTAKVPDDLYRRWVMARRNLNNQKDFLERFRAPTGDEVMLRTVPRRNPALLAAPEKLSPEVAAELTTKQKIEQQLFEVTQEMHRARIKTLERGADQITDWSKASVPEFQQRQVLGPDDAEVAGDGLNMLIRSGGLAVDDVTLLPVAPEYYVTPAVGPLPIIPWRHLDMAGDVTKAERRFLSTISGKALPEYPGQPIYDTKTSTKRMLIRYEDIIRRNLGTARSTKDKEAIKLYERQLELNRKAQRAADGINDDVVYEDTWAPAKDQPTIMSSPERFNRWLQVAGDRVSRSLYPGALRIGYWNSRPGKLHNYMREPQRFYEVTDPEGWNIIRNDRLRYEQSVDAWNDMSLKELEKIGAIKHRDKFNPLKHWAPYTINHGEGTADELLFDLLNTVKGSDEYTKLIQDSGKRITPELMAAHDKIRKALDTAADYIGIRDTDRYLEGYIHHYFDKAQFANGARPLEFVGLPKHVELWARHLMERRGNAGYVRSAAQALEVYGRAMHRKTILEPMFEKILQRGQAKAAELGNPHIATFTRDYVNTLRGRPTTLGRALDEWIGGALNKKGGVLWNPNEIDRRLMGLTSMWYAGILTGNPHYPFMQMATAIPTTSMRYGLFRTARGLFQMATKEGQALSKVMGTYKPFLDIFESPIWQRGARLATEVIPTVGPFGVMTNAGAERAIRGMTAHAAIDMYLTKFGFATWDEAVKAGWGRPIAFHALRASEEVNHMFGSHGRSPVIAQKFGHGFSVAATQFLSFTWKQTDELLSQFGKGGLEGMGRLMQYFAVSGWLSQIAAQDLGIDATRYVGLGYLPGSLEDMTSPAVDAFSSTVELVAALTEMDPERIERASLGLLNNFDNLIPFMGGIEAGLKGAQRLSEKQVTSTRGERLYGMDFAETLPEDIGEMGVENVAQSIRPGTEPPGIGGEFLPTVLGQQNIRETLFRRGMQAKSREDKRFYYNARTAVNNYVEAAESGDSTAEARLAQELQDVYKIRLGGDTMIRRAIEARQISWALRQVDPALGGNEKMFDRYMKIFRENGIGLEP